MGSAVITGSRAYGFTEQVMNQPNSTSPARPAAARARLAQLLRALALPDRTGSVASRWKQEVMFCASVIYMLQFSMFEIRQTQEFREWLHKLRDARARVKIADRRG